MASECGSGDDGEEGHEDNKYEGQWLEAVRRVLRQRLRLVSQKHFPGIRPMADHRAVLNDLHVTILVDFEGVRGVTGGWRSCTLAHGLVCHKYRSSKLSRKTERSILCGFAVKPPDGRLSRESGLCFAVHLRSRHVTKSQSNCETGKCKEFT